MLTTFNPVRFSNAENQFLLEHIGKPPVVALREIKGMLNPKAHPKDKNPVIYPEGVIPASVKPVLEGIYELCELEKHDGAQWVGLEKVKQAIRVWLSINAKWLSDSKRMRNAPRYPSLSSYDAKGRPHLGGPGSDAGEVKTYFGPAGERIPFEISLLAEYVPEWQGPLSTEAPMEAGLRLDPDSHRLECMIALPDGTRCGHAETYKVDSRASYNAARARMSKHLRRATQEVEAHRELHTNEFGSGDVQK